MEAVNERSLKKFGHGLQQIFFTLRAQYQPLSLRGSFPRYPCLSRAHRVRNTPSLPSTLRIHCKPKPERVKIDIEFICGDQITWERNGSAFRPERWEAVLFKGLNGRIAFSPFEPGELSVRKRSLRRWSLGSWLER